jgi:outer membrane protein assembly factor BamB
MRLFRATLQLVPIAVVGSFLFVEGIGPAQAQAPNYRLQSRRTPVRKGAPPPPSAAGNPSVNPLSKLFRNLLGDGGKDSNRLGADDDEATGSSADRRGPRDVIDGRIPHNSSQGKQLEQTEQLIAAGHWDQALERLEHVLANSDHATVRTSDGRPGLVAWEANRLLGRLPASALETYRLRHEAQARQLFRDAQQTGNWDQVMDVATQFFHTQTGEQAANSVGNFHFDRGEFGLASLWYARLLESAPSWTQDPKWRLKVALALRESGNAAAGDELLRRLQQNGTDVPVDVGGDSVKPEAWLKQFAGVDQVSIPVLQEWLQFLGSSRRTGTAAGGDPLLLSRWFHPTTQNKAVLDQMASLAQDLADSGRAPIPAAFPLMVKDRVAFRTLRGVHVLDATTGHLLWETRGEFSEDSLVAGYRSPFDFENGFAFRRMRGTPWRTDFVGNESGADGHPLTGLLYRNANFGLLASDGARLFVIEDEGAVMHGPAGTGFQLVGDTYESQRRTPGNRLAAYDLATGREAWAIGGPANGESFDLPLAGHFFFGAPLVDGGELFVVAERDLDIRLYALDPDTGRVRWSQLLAHSDGKIEQDLGRRWWTAQVAFSNGILVCPTTVGWLVGVDRLDHSVLWMGRYASPRPGAERREREQGESLVPPSELNAQWCASAPVIAGNHVVYTPSEEPVLVCLDLSSGLSRWRVQKGEDQLYLGGVDDERVIVVGKSSVTALALETGAVQWTTPIDESQGPPSGRGVTAKGVFYLPLKNGSLWAIELASGKVVETSQLPPENKPLGNLAMYRGLVLSLNAFGLTAFEQREAIGRQIADRQATDPRDPWASIKQAEIALLHHDPGQALASLDRVDANRVEPALSSSYRSGLFEALTASVRHDYATGDKALQRLSGLARTGDERLVVDRLQAEQAVAKGEFGTAFEVFRRLAIGDRPGLTIPRPDDPRVAVDFDQWVAGQLEETWVKMSAAQRTRVDLLLRGEADHALRMDRPFQERFVRLYGFHPGAARVIATLVDDFAANRDLFHAERLLLRQIRGVDRNVAAAAQLRLARLLDEFGLQEDADAAYRELAYAFPSVPLDRGVRADRFVSERRDAGLLPSAAPAGTDWGDVDLRVYRFGTNYLSQHIEELELGHASLPFFRDHRFAIDERRQRLEVVRANNDAQHWLLPLRSVGGRNRQGDYTVGLPTGHELVVLHGDVIHFLAPVERRVLWTRPLDVPSGFGGEYRSPHAAGPQPLRGGSQFAARYSLLSRSTRNGMLAAANTEYVCLYGRREFLVLDAETGDVRWKCSNVPQHTTIFGNEDAVYMIPPDRSNAAAFRATDGKRLETEKLGDLLVTAVAVTPRGLVTVDGVSGGILGLEAPKTVVRLIDPISRKEFWKIEYPGGTSLSLLDDMRILAVSASGQIERVDLANGDVLKFEEKYPARELHPPADVYAIADRDRVFLFKNRHRQRSMEYPEGFRSSLTVGGRIFAFDAHQGKLLWQQDVSPHSLVLDSVHDSPMLTFVWRTLVHNREFGHWSVHILVIDKRTGRQVLSTVDSSASNFRTLELNMAERYIELRSYNQRVRLIAVNRQGLSAK